MADPTQEGFTLRPIDRRTFLGLGIGAAAWACGRGTDDVAVPTPEPEVNMFSLIGTNPPGALAVGDRRMAFAFLDGERPITPRPQDVRMMLAPPGGTAPDPLEPRIESIRLGVGGAVDEQQGTEVHTLGVIEHPLEVPGIWSVQAEVRHEGETKRATATFEVVEAEETPTPTVGEQAIAVPSPTIADPLDADPICTRQPACSMHEITVEEAVGSGTPSVIMFATPAFCTSRTCGPVIDIAESFLDEYADRINFVHVEVWKNPEVVQQEDGAVQAFTDWRLQVEPWIFFVDADGVIRERWAGAWGLAETERALGVLAAGEL